MQIVHTIAITILKHLPAVQLPFLKTIMNIHHLALDFGHPKQTFQDKVKAFSSKECVLVDNINSSI